MKKRFYVVLFISIAIFFILVPIAIGVVSPKTGPEDNNNVEEVHACEGMVSPIDDLDYNCTHVDGGYICKRPGEVCACLSDGSCVCD